MQLGRATRNVVHLHLEDIADFGPDEALVDSRRDAAGPYLVDEVVCDEAVGRLAVTAAVHVQSHQVAVAGRTSDLGERGELLA